MLTLIDKRLTRCGLLMRQSTTVDATLMSASGSTKNEGKARDRDIRQSKKDVQWCFGMKVHIGVDAQSGRARTAPGGSGNVHDVVQANIALHCQERGPKAIRAS